MKREEKNVSFGGGCAEGLKRTVLRVFWREGTANSCRGDRKFQSGVGGNRNAGDFGVSLIRLCGLDFLYFADALSRSFMSDIATYAMLVDAKDDKVAAFYLHHGFIPLPDSPLSLFLPLATASSI